jgi:hypothetical protein
MSDQPSTAAPLSVSATVMRDCPRKSVIPGWDVGAVFCSSAIFCVRILASTSHPCTKPKKMANEHNNQSSEVKVKGAQVRIL